MISININRRGYLAASGAALGGVLAAACDASQLGLTGGGSKKALSGQVEFWAFGEGPKQEHLVKRFEAKNPAVQVTTTLGVNMDKVITAVAGGGPPDISAALHSNIAVIGSRGLAVPLDDALKGTRWRATDLLDGMRAAVSYKGKVLATPYITDAIPIGINLNLLEQANLRIPARNWTWTDLAEYATRLTIRTGDQTKQWGMLCPRAPDNLALTMFGQVLHSMGGTWLTADGTKASFASAQGIAALDFWVDLVRRRRVSPIPWLPQWTQTRQGAGSVNPTNPLDEAFLHGGNEGVAMRPLQTFSVNAVKALATFRWEAVLPPQQPKLASMQGGGNWFLLKDAPHKDPATAFLLHLADAEELALWAVDAQRLPTYKTVANHPIYQEFLKKAPELRVHWDTAQGSVTSSPPVAGWADGEPALRNAIFDSLQGTTTPAGALQDAANQMDAALARARST